jgi:hypothetical protein
MQDVIWLAVCIVSVVIMAAYGWRDRKRAAVKLCKEKEEYRYLARDNLCLARASELANRKVKSCRQRSDELLHTLTNIHRLAAVATGKDDGDWSGPITVGDPERDPLFAEISLCGPNHIAIYATRKPDAGPTAEWIMNTSLIGLRRRGSVLFMTHAGVGLANARNLAEITDAIREYNETFHKSKGVDCAGFEQKAGTGVCDSGGTSCARDHGHCGEDPRRQGEARCACRPGRAGSSPGSLRADRSVAIKASRQI